MPKEPTPTGEPAAPEPPGEGGANGGDGGNGGQPAKMSALRENVATWMAVVVIIALGVFYWFMLREAKDPNELLWTRRMMILNGVEAIVFAAAGFLFGTQIQRRADSAQVESEKKKADNAEQRLDAARGQLDDGKVLAGMVEVQSGGVEVPEESEYRELGSGKIAAVAGLNLGALRRQARKVIGDSS